MMEHSQPSLLQLLVPNSAVARGLLDKREEQDSAAYSVTSAAAAAERTVSALAATKVATTSPEGTQSTMALTRSDDAAAAANVAAPRELGAFTTASGGISHDIAPFKGNGSSLTMSPNTQQRTPNDEGLRRSIGGGAHHHDGGDDEDNDHSRYAETTASSRTTFSLVARRNNPSPYPTAMADDISTITAAAAAAASAFGSDVPGQTASFNPASNAAVVAATTAASAADADTSIAAAAVGASSATANASGSITSSFFDAVARKASIFTTNFANSSTTAAAPSVSSAPPLPPSQGPRRRRSTRVNIVFPTEAEWESQRETSAQPRGQPLPPPPPRSRRTTLVGGSDIYDSAEVATQKTEDLEEDEDVDEEDDYDNYYGDPAATSTLTNDGALGPPPPTNATAKTGTPVSEYISNLFMSFDLELCAAEGHAPPQVLHTGNSVVSSSFASSACPSPTSQRTRTSLKMRSTTMAPIPNACSSTTSSNATAGTTASATAGHSSHGGGVRRFSQGFAPRANAVINGEDGVRRASRVTFLPGERLTDASAVPGSPHSTEVPASKSSEDRSSVLVCASPSPKEDTLSATGSERALASTMAAAVATDDDTDAYANTATSGTTDNEATMDVQPALALPRADANPLVLSEQPSQRRQRRHHHHRQNQPNQPDSANATAAGVNSSGAGDANSETGSAMSGVSLDASTSTQRQHTSLPISSSTAEHVRERRATGASLLGVAGSRDSSTVMVAATSHGEQHASEVSGVLFDGHEKSPNLAASLGETQEQQQLQQRQQQQRKSDSSHSISMDACTTSLVTPQSESLSMQGATPSFITTSLHLPFVDPPRSSSLNVSFSGSVSEFGPQPQGGGGRYGQLYEDLSEDEASIPTRPPSNRGNFSSSSSSPTWLRGAARLPSRAASFATTFVWRHVMKGKLLLASLLSAAKRTLFLPFLLTAGAGVGSFGEGNSHTYSNAAVHRAPEAKSTKQKPQLSMQLPTSPSGASFPLSPSLRERWTGSGVAGPRTNSSMESRGGCSSLSATLRLSLPLSRSPSQAACELDPRQQPQHSQAGSPSSQVVEGLQQTLRETWNGAANAWFASDTLQEPRTALRGSSRIRGNPSMVDHTPLSPRVLSTLPQPRSSANSRAGTGSGSGGGQCGLGDDSALHSQRNTTPSSPHLSFAESFAAGFEGLSNSDVFNRGALLPIPRTLGLAATGSNTSLTRGSPSFEHPHHPRQASFTRQNRSGTTNAAAPAATAATQSALMDDVYREQLYREFENPPSCCIGDLSGCFAAYKAMVETSSNGHHVLNWKELSLLLLPEDYIDYRDLFPPYHFVTFPDFVEFVEVVSVRHRR